ncbi:MAG: hypothetical protein QM831_20385 [Kofleriaceae bacterium]
MRWAVSVVALAACNDAFGLHAGHRVDAAYFDAGIDARAACPTDHPPAYSRDFDQVVVENCSELSIGGRYAAALCANNELRFGELDAMLSPDPAFTATDPGSALTVPRLSPDGATLVANDPLGTNNLYDVVQFHRNGTSWTRGTPIISSIAAGAITSEISTDGRILVELGPGHVHEYVRGNDDSWTDAGIRLELAESPTPISGVHLMPDALHAYRTPVGGPTQWFVRDSVDQIFALQGVVDGTTEVEDPVIADGCGALYFFTLGRLWVAPRPTS